MTARLASLPTFVTVEGKVYVDGQWPVAFSMFGSEAVGKAHVTMIQGGLLITVENGGAHYQITARDEGWDRYELHLMSAEYRGPAPAA